MSCRSTVVLIELPGGGEVHLYDTFDPAFLTGNEESQRRINVRLPNSANPVGLPGGIDYDEPLTEEYRRAL